MKTLYLLRHAKSSWDDAALRDFERPLNKRGRRAAPLVGEYMRGQNIRPDLVVSSPAERAKQTTALVAEAAGLPAAGVRYDERIYDADVPRLLEVVSRLDAAAQEAMLVGHNPGFEDLLRHLTGEDVRMPTAALACVRLDLDEWGEVGEGAGRLEWLVKPKELESG